MLCNIGDVLAATMPTVDADTITGAGKISDELWPTDADIDGPESQLARTRATLKAARLRSEGQRLLANEERILAEGEGP